MVHQLGRVSLSYTNTIPDVHGERVAVSRSDKSCPRRTVGIRARSAGGGSTSPYRGPDDHSTESGHQRRTITRLRSAPRTWGLLNSARITKTSTMASPFGMTMPGCLIFDR